MQVGAEKAPKQIPIKQISYFLKKVTVTSAQNPEMGYFDLLHGASGPPRSGGSRAVDSKGCAPQRRRDVAKISDLAFKNRQNELF